jgi:hypothetical protein
MYLGTVLYSITRATRMLGQTMVELARIGGWGRNVHRRIGGPPDFAVAFRTSRARR